MKQIWKDTALTLSASTNYTIETDGKVVFSGRCDMQPDGTCEILTNKACQYWVRQDYPEFAGVTQHHEALRKFTIKGELGETLASEEFMYDWSYEDKNASAETLSNPVNGVLDPRMRMMFTSFNEKKNLLEVNSPCFDNPPDPPQPVAGYELTLEITEPGTVRFGAVSGLNVNIEYSLDSGITWLAGKFARGSSATTINVSEGDTVMLRGGTPCYSGCTVGGTSEFAVRGNIMSLLYGGQREFYDIELTQENDYAFQRLFYQSNVVSASALTLPATTAEGCFKEMFEQCELLVDAPDIRAEEIADRACEQMFMNCPSLRIPPAISSRYIGDNGFAEMFSYCTSLTASTEIDVVSAGSGAGYGFGGFACYQMFYGCEALKTARKIKAATAYNNAFREMFGSCTALEAPPEIEVDTLDIECFRGMFEGCTSLRYGPELPNMTLAENCYSYMFSGCTSLTEAPELPAETLASGCYSFMFAGCTSLSTAPDLESETLASSCYSSMFKNCISLVNVPSELPATTLYYGCYNSMFIGCTSLETAPDLPDATLADVCYWNMFRDCSKLSYIKCLSDPYLTYSSHWVDGVAENGTFVKAAGSSWQEDVSGIPVGWVQLIA